MFTKILRKIVAKRINNSGHCSGDDKGTGHCY